MVNECSWYCEGCNQDFCEHCEKPEEIDEEIYCEDCAKEKNAEANKDALVENHEEGEGK